MEPYAFIHLAKTLFLLPSVSMDDFEKPCFKIIYSYFTLRDQRV